MSKQVYISADYDGGNGDSDVVELLNSWGTDNKHKVDFIDMSAVISGSVSSDPDCRPCDLKQEFNRQINASSAVIFVVGDKTATRSAGSNCPRSSQGCWVSTGCTPYKQNTNGTKGCKYKATCSAGDDIGNINTYSYLKHEFLQAQKRDKKIIIVYNSLTKQSSWLPSYMAGYENYAQPFWKKDYLGNKVGNYEYIKKALGYE